MKRPILSIGLALGSMFWSAAYGEFRALWLAGVALACLLAAVVLLVVELWRGYGALGE